MIRATLCFVKCHLSRSPVDFVYQCITLHKHPHFCWWSLLLLLLSLLLLLLLYTNIRLLTFFSLDCSMKCACGQPKRKHSKTTTANTQATSQTLSLQWDMNPHLQLKESTWYLSYMHCCSYNTKVLLHKWHCYLIYLLNPNARSILFSRFEFFFSFCDFQ